MKKKLSNRTWQKALNLQNTRSRLSYFENQVFVRDVMRKCDAISITIFPIKHYGKIDCFVCNCFSYCVTMILINVAVCCKRSFNAKISETTPARKQKFFLQ